MKTEFNKLDLELYKYKLDNGLEIFVIPNPKVNNIYATFSTKYGSIHSSFIPNQSKKMITVPNGIAHFLEHKLFEQPGGVEPFSFFGERGADANANTSQYKTTYLFSGLDFLEDNLNYLLDFVQTPYFTDENVLKEKGIIEQEIKMYRDDPSSRIFEQTLFNTFVENPIRIGIAGTVKSINKITKEDLYLCYNTFYHPANMFVVVTGNVNPDNIYNLIKENQSKKEYVNDFSLKIKNYNEPDNTYKEKETLRMNVTIPKCSLAFKINIEKFKKHDKFDLLNYLLLFLDIKFDMTSSLIQKIKEEGIINDSLQLYYIESDKHVFYYIDGDTKVPNKLIDYIKKEIKNKKITKEDFERKKKVYLSSYITVSDNIFSMNSLVMNHIIKYNEVLTDIYDRIKNYNFKDLNNIIEKINFDITSEVIILPKTENE